MRRWVRELRRRHVFRAVGTYLVVAATVVGTAEPLVTGLRLPDSAVSIVVWLAIAGLPISIWLAWSFDLTAAGLARTDPEGDDDAPPAERVVVRSATLVVGGMLLGGVAVALLLLRPWGDRGADEGPWIPALVGGEVRAFTSDASLDLHPSWSPDGGQLTFGRVDGGDMNLYVSGLVGTPVPITSNPSDDISPRWSPDGSRIAYLSDRGSGLDLFWISPTGGRERPVTGTGIPLLDSGWIWFRGLGSQPWSPDGVWLLFSRQDPDTGAVAVWRVDVDSGEEVRVTFPPPGAEDLGATWSPDGQRILFDRTEGGNSTIWLIEDVDSDAPQSARLTSEETVDFGAAWFPDSRTFVYAAPRGVSSGARIANVDAPEASRLLPTPGRTVYQVAVGPNGAIAMATAAHHSDLWLGRRGSPVSEHRNLTENSVEAMGASFADGERILFHSNREATTFDIWEYRLDTGEQRPLTEHPAQDLAPDAGPDGAMVFASGRDGDLRVWIQDGPDEAPRRLMEGVVHMPCDRITTYCRGPRWSPDGSRIGVLVSTDGGRRLQTVSPDGSGLDGLDVSGVISFDWYLDGDRLLYLRRPPGGGETELRARHLGTGVDRLLLTGFWGEPTLSEDGALLALVTARSHYRMDVVEFDLTAPDAADGLPRLASESRPVIQGQGRWHVHNPALSPDSRWIAYTRDTDLGDLYILEPAR